jgi:hypothetical protein
LIDFAKDASRSRQSEIAELKQAQQSKEKNLEGLKGNGSRNYTLVSLSFYFDNNKPKSQEPMNSSARRR